MIKLEHDFGNYIIRCDGKLYSKKVGRFLKGCPTTTGYIRYWVNGKSEYAHRLVAKYFIPNPDNLPQVNHKDMNPSNNKVANLEWMTNGENVKHSYDNNPTRLRGDWCGESRRKVLTESQVREIVYLLSNKMVSQRELSRQMKVDRKVFSNIFKGISHRDITGFSKEDK